MRRTEEETGEKSLIPPEAFIPEAKHAPPKANHPDWHSEVPPLRDRRSTPGFPPLPRAEYRRLERPSKPSRLPKFNGTSVAIEEYRKMKHKILTNGSGKAVKTLLFCSSHGGEGNSTVAVNFAQTLSAEGYRVLLVDTNLRRPTLHRLFHLEQDNGLTDLCFGGSNLGLVIKPSLLPNLWVVTSGDPYSNPAAIFESEFFDSLVERMKMQADWVIFDSPPLSSCGDAITLARKMDGVVLVVQSERTRREVVLQYKERLQKSGAHILGVVLNKRRFHIPQWVYNRL